MAPLIENYRERFRSRGKWIYVPSAQGERRGEQVLNFLRKIDFPDYYFHYRAGGHVAALHQHRENNFFFKIDIENFFYSIARNRIHRALASRGMPGAPTYAKWSTVRSPYPTGPRYVLPIGFVQSCHLASLILMQSPVFDALERALTNGVLISVYLDDIVGSHADKDKLALAYDDIRQACADAQFVPNIKKLTPPSETIVAFNCDLSKGETKVTARRVEKFFSEDQEPPAQQAFIAYMHRVAAI